MIGIFTALYCEAQPFIRRLKLKRNPDINRFQVFSGDEASLLITGTGAIQAALGVTSFYSVHPPEPEDILVNIGICGTTNEDTAPGSLFLCNKIYEQGSGRCFYPDILFSHPFQEAGINTCFKIVDIRPEASPADLPEILTDMEASGVYQAASLFFQPHRMFFLKIVSDHMKGEHISPEMATSLVDTNVSAVTEWLFKLQREIPVNGFAFTGEEELCLKRLTECLKLSVSMENQLRQLMRWHRLNYGTFTDAVNLFIETNRLEECRSKNEGKIYFDLLKKQFI